MEERIKRYGGNHIAGQKIAHVVEKSEQHRMRPGMMVAVGGNAQNLGELVDAVRGHDAGILVEKVRQPAKQADDKCAQRCVISIEAADFAEPGRKPGVLHMDIASRTII